MKEVKKLEYKDLINITNTIEKFVKDNKLSPTILFLNNKVTNEKESKYVLLDFRKSADDHSSFICYELVESALKTIVIREKDVLGTSSITFETYCDHLGLLYEKEEDKSIKELEEELSQADLADSLRIIQQIVEKDNFLVNITYLDRKDPILALLFNLNIKGFTEVILLDSLNNVKHTFIPISSLRSITKLDPKELIFGFREGELLVDRS
jgi:hypothetical protein